MIYTPCKRIKTNFLIVIAFFLVFVVSIIFTKEFSLPDAVWQGVFFLVAIISCELTVKFFLPVYTYSFDEGAFVITKTLGKNVRTVCNIDTPRIVAVITKEEYKKQEEYSPRSVYNYNGNIVPNSCYVLIFEYSNCFEAVIFEPDKKMADAIRAVIRNR